METEESEEEDWEEQEGEEEEEGAEGEAGSSFFYSAQRKDLDGSQWIRRRRITRKQMDDLIMNYFVVQGFRNAAQTFAKEAKSTPPVDLQTLEDRACIRVSIIGGNIAEAIDRINAMNTQLLQDDFNLRFRLQKQQLVELIRNKKAVEALQFAQKELAWVANQQVGRPRPLAFHPSR